MHGNRAADDPNRPPVFLHPLSSAHSPFPPSLTSVCAPAETFLLAVSRWYEVVVFTASLQVRSLPAFRSPPAPRETNGSQCDGPGRIRTPHPHPPTRRVTDLKAAAAPGGVLPAGVRRLASDGSDRDATPSLRVSGTPRGRSSFLERISESTRLRVSEGPRDAQVHRRAAKHCGQAPDRRRASDGPGRDRLKGGLE
jgi:hypothetical protein